jgi:hypothetical protein
MRLHGWKVFAQERKEQRGQIHLRRLPRTPSVRRCSARYNRELWNNPFAEKRAQYPYKNERPKSMQPRFAGFLLSNNLLFAACPLRAPQTALDAGRPDDTPVSVRGDGKQPKDDYA